MASRDDLVRELDAAHNEFREAISGLDRLERMSRGERPELETEVPWAEVDKWNDVFASHAKGKRHHQILYELNHALDSFKQAAAKLPEERFAPRKTKMFDATGIEHFREHAGMVRAWRGRSGAT
jgi:hypothetical protein